MPELFKTLLLSMAHCLPVYVALRVWWHTHTRRTQHGRAAKRGLNSQMNAAKQTHYMSNHIALAVSWPRELLMGAFTLFMLGLLALVLQPGTANAGATVPHRLQHGIGVNLIPGATIGRFWRGGPGGAFNINIIGNVAMFVPLGLCPPLLWRRWRPLWKMALLALAFPLCIETAQLFLGRSVDIDDVLLNAAGILLGASIASVAQKLYNKKES